MCLCLLFHLTKKIYIQYMCLCCTNIAKCDIFISIEFDTIQCRCELNCVLFTTQSSPDIIYFIDDALFLMDPFLFQCFFSAVSHSHWQCELCVCFVIVMEKKSLEMNERCVIRFIHREFRAFFCFFFSAFEFPLRNNVIEWIRWDSFRMNAAF